MEWVHGVDVMVGNPVTTVSYLLSSHIPGTIPTEPMCVYGLGALVGWAVSCVSKGAVWMLSATGTSSGSVTNASMIVGSVTFEGPRGGADTTVWVVSLVVPPGSGGASACHKFEGDVVITVVRRVRLSTAYLVTIRGSV